MAPYDPYATSFNFFMYFHWNRIGSFFAMKANLIACVREHVYSAFHFITTLEISVVYFLMNNTKTFLIEIMMEKAR